MAATDDGNAKKERGGLKVEITRAFVTFVDKFRRDNKMSQIEFGDKYLIKKTTWNEWVKADDKDLKVEKFLLARICYKFFKEDNLLPEQLYLPEHTCHIIRRIFDFNPKTPDVSKRRESEIREFEMYYQAPKETSYPEFVQAVLAETLKQLAIKSVDFSAKNGSVIFTFSLTDDQIDTLLLAIQDGSFSDCGLFDYGIAHKDEETTADYGEIYIRLNPPFGIPSQISASEGVLESEFEIKVDDPNFAIAALAVLCDYLRQNPKFLRDMRQRALDLLSTSKLSGKVVQADDDES